MASWKAFKTLAAGAVLLVMAGSALAQNTGSLQAATCTGADRYRRLMDAACNEGELMVYTSVPVDDRAVLTAAFEKKYGVKVEV